MGTRFCGGQGRSSGVTVRNAVSLVLMLEGKVLFLLKHSPASPPFFSLTALRQLVVFRAEVLVIKQPIGCPWQWSAAHWLHLAVVGSVSPPVCLHFPSYLSLLEFTPGITHCDCEPMLVSCHLKKPCFEDKLKGSGRFMVKVSRPKEEVEMNFPRSCQHERHTGSYGTRMWTGIVWPQYAWSIFLLHWLLLSEDPGSSGFCKCEEDLRVGQSYDSCLFSSFFLGMVNTVVNW